MRVNTIGGRVLCVPKPLCVNTLVHASSLILDDRQRRGVVLGH